MELRVHGGVVDLRDLSAFPWTSGALGRHLEPIGLHTGVGPRFRATLPPARLVVIADLRFPERALERHAWLAAAGSLWLLLDPGEDRMDPELEPLVAEEWGAVATRLGNVAHLDALPEGDVAVLQVALDWARACNTPWPSEPVPTPPRAWPSGSWIEVTGSASVAPRVFTAPDGPRLVADGGRSHPLSEPAPAPLILERQGASLERVVTGAGPVGPDYDAREHWGFPFGHDAVRPLAAAGYRSRFTWLFGGSDGLSRWCTSAHDWPCGQARKLYGYSNNRPGTLSVAPDATAVVSRFLHDTLLCSAVPLAWREHGGLAVADWPGDPGADPLRAVFFQAETGEGRYPADPTDPEDEDARWAAPVVVLGPGEQRRYAVDLSEQTWRILEDGSSTHLGGPADAWAVYDADHREVARFPGRLLGGAWRWATVLEGDRLVRVDLQTSERTELGAAGRPVAQAAPVPGAANVVLRTEGAVRLV